LKALAALVLALSIAAVAAPARGDDGTLDVATLRVRLKDTPAIGFVAKLRLKSQIEDLMEELSAYHAGHAGETLEALHARYRGLVVSVVGLLEHGDTRLAHDLDTSADHLWNTLADPGQFASLAKS
jgi:hypothetical protein